MGWGESQPRVGGAVLACYRRRRKVVIMHLVDVKRILVDVKHSLVDVTNILISIQKKIWIYLGCQAMLMFFGCALMARTLPGLLGNN